MPPAEFEPAVPARERPQTHALERGTGTGYIHNALLYFPSICFERKDKNV